MTQTWGDDGKPREPDRPADNLLGSVFVTLFCCAPFGIVAIIYGLRVRSQFKAGDLAGAKYSSDMSEKWMYGGIGAAILLAIAYGILWFFSFRK